MSVLVNPIIRKKCPSFTGLNDFRVDALLRNLGFGIAPYPPTPSSVTSCPVLVFSGILPASGWSNGVGILV